MKTTESYDEIKPLNELCKAGKLFEVQDWLKDGRPVNVKQPEKGNRRRSPLEIAIERGFHSLVQVLLEAGAVTADNRYNALEDAVDKKRLDIIKLLIVHGANLKSVDMFNVFLTWDPAIMEYFIEQGADVETGYPLACAFCERIRSALGVYNRHKDRFPSFKEQANIALRYHCKEGNLKWVSLMLWLGADPYAPGLELDDLFRELDPEEEIWCALEYAASHRNYEIFKLKQIKLDPQSRIATELLGSACFSKDSGFLKLLLENNFKPEECEEEGTFLIQRCLRSLEDFWDYMSGHGPARNLDTEKSREKMKMIHLLAKNGAKWKPQDKSIIKDARQALIKMLPDYTVQFIRIMAEYKASNRKCIEELIRTPSIKTVISEHRRKVQELLQEL